MVDIRKSGAASEHLQSEPLHPDAEPFAKSTHALQATIDVLGEFQDLDQLAPRLLRIIAETFGAENCAFFKNCPSGEVRLLYFHTGGRTLPPDELMRLESGNFATSLSLAQRFEVPEADLGLPAPGAIALSNGWGLELNIGIASRGVRAFSLCIYRERTHPFSDQEIRLAEALAKQLGLAVELNRLADEAREAAAAGRREEQARRINDFLVKTVGSISSGGDMSLAAEAVILELARTLEASHVHLFRHDRETRTIRLSLSYLEGKLRWGMSGDECPLFANPFPDDITCAWKIMCEERRLFTPELSTVPPEMFAWPGALEYAQRLNFSDMGHIVLFAGGTPVGSIGFAFRNGRRLKPDDSSFIEAAAQQTAIVIRLLDLGEEAKQAAMAREREQAAEDRAAEARRLNDFLSTTLGTLAEGADLRQTVESILMGLSQEIGAAHVFLFRRDAAAKTIALELSCVDGRVRRGPSGEELPLWAAAFPEDITPAWQIMMETRGLFTPEMCPIAVEEFAWPGTFEYVSRFNLSDVGHIILFSGEESVGSIGFALSDGRRLSPSDKPFIEGVAKQAAVAIRMADLGEEARESAIAREREASAQAQIELLSASNEALRRGVQQASQSGGFGALLESLLLESTEVMGAAGGAITLWRNGQYDGTECVAENGAIVPREQWESDPYFREGPVGLGTNPGGFTSRLLAAPYTRESIERTREVWPAAANYHGMRGHVEVWSLACVSQDKLVASLSLAFRRARDAGPVLIGTLTALAQQIALMIEMSRLAEQAKAAALMHEREEIARLRAVELSKANDAMRQAIESLAIKPDLIPFAGQLLTIIGQQFGAPVVEYWTNADANIAQLKLTCRDGQLYAGSDMENDPRVSGIRISPKMTQAPDLYSPRAHFVTNDLPNDPDQHAVFTPLGLNLEAWCDSRNVRKHLNVPLRSGEKTFGALCIYIPADQHFTDVRIELAYALAHQMTLAIRLTDLALESQRATIAKERDQAALEKAAGLVRANEALRRGAERIASVSGDSNAILDIFLLESLRAVKASAGAIVRRVDGGTECVMQSLAQDDELVRPFDLHAIESRYRIATATDISGVMRRTMDGESFLFGIEEVRDWFPEAYEYHLGRGHRMVGHFPLMTNNRVIGYLGLAFREDEPDPMVFETVKALAVQASMALEMKRLADETRASAVALEQDKATREKAAQLARANDALKASLGKMSTGTSGAALLEGMLAVLRDSMNAVSVALRIRDPRVLATIRDDRYALEPCGAFPGFAAHMEQRQPLFLLVSEDETLPDEAKATLSLEGVRSQLAIPMLLGEELIGALMIRLSSDQRPANEQWELARALGHQATLAIRLTQLAAEARQEARAKAASEERAAIARELHDTLLQSFTGVMLQLRALGLRALPDDAARADLSSIERQATEAVHEARLAVGAMRGRPEVDLPSDLRRFIESIRATTGLAADFTEEGTRWAVPPSAAGGLLRVAQEALRNAARHSGGTRMRAGLSYSSGSVQIVISDNGCGFDLAQAQAMPGHFGIGGMRERAQEIGAVLEIHSAPRQGTSVRIRYDSGSGLEKSGSASSGSASSSSESSSSESSSPAIVS